jgi:flagellar FliL protein
MAAKPKFDSQGMEVGAAQAGAKKSPPIAIVIGVTALIAFGIGFVVMKSVFGKSAAASPAQTQEKVGKVVSLDEFLINLADPSNDHYLKTIVSVGLVEGKSDEEFKNVKAQARDCVVMILSAKKLSDVRTGAGKEKLKREIKDSINKSLGEKTVVAVYFESFATQ